MAWFRDQVQNPKGMKHSYGNYSSSQSSKSYEAKSEQIIQFWGGVPTMMTYEHSSPRKEEHPLLPWGGLVRDRPEKLDGLSPRFREAVHIKDKGSPRKDFFKENSPLARDHEFGKYNHFDNNDDDSDDDYECDGGASRVKDTKLGARPNSFKEGGYDRSFEKYKGDGYDHSEPRKHTYYDKSYDDLDLENDKRKLTHAPSFNTQSCTFPSSNQPQRDKYYDTSYNDQNNEKEKGKFHGAYNHTVPSSNLPKTDTYYDQAAPGYYNDKRKGDDYTPPYTVPVTTIPKKDIRPMMPNPPPIKTRTDSWGRDAEYYNENGKNSPKYNSPRKDQGYGETIDGSEARRRYGKVDPPRGAVYVAEDYTAGVIDAREAARRYKGVLLTS